MRLFPKRKSAATAQTQMCASADRGWMPRMSAAADPAEYRLYRELRTSVPVIDAAIMKLIRLLGSFELRCADERSQTALDRFVRTVKVGGVGVGLNSFVWQYFDQLLTAGTAVGEIVTYPDGEFAALSNVPPEAFELRRGDDPLDVRICAKDGLASREVAHPELILVTLLNPEPNAVYGRSILKGLPFVTDILMKIFACIGQNFERAGNVRFAVTYHPAAGASAVNARQRVQEISDEWSRAMRDREKVCDFVSVGDVSIKAIGADSQILDCDVPVRHILEQIVAKLSIPPFLLGLSWSATERMSAQQADILTSELEYYRAMLTPVIERIARLFLRAEGLDPAVDTVWSNISLQDETELAAARLNNGSNRIWR